MVPSIVTRVDDAISAWCLKRSHNIKDLRKYARLRVPSPMFHYMDGAADDEVTLAHNCSDYDRYELLPRYLVDVSDIDTRTTVMGQPIDFPIICAPTGMSRLFNNAGELAVSQAAAEAGTVYSLSTVSTYSIEEVAEVCSGPKWFQIYVFSDRALITEFMERCRAAKYHGLILTIDVPVPGNRERDLYTGMSIPPQLTLASWLDFFLHPLWSTKRMVKEWNGPFAIKGICCAEDAVRAADIGATAVILSNHGGRQLDNAPSPISLVAEVKAAVGDRVEIICDGGVRRGTDVLKALALGAQACMIGRPYLFGLGAGGQAGVARALEILRTEIARDMALLGCTKVEQINEQYIRERRPV